MDEKEARRLAGDWGAYNDQAKDGLPVAEIRNGYENTIAALTRQATDLIPETAVAAALHRGEGRPLLAAVEVDNKALSLLDALPPERDRGRGILRRMVLDPTKSVVHATCQWDRGSHGELRMTDWKFTLGEISLTFRTECWTDEAREMPDDEAFALALCKALDWDLPEPGGAALRAA